MNLDQILKIKGCFCIVICGDLQSLSNLSKKAQADSLIEIKTRGASIDNRSDGVIIALVAVA